MCNERVSRLLQLSLICVLAVAANLLVMIFRHLAVFPLFLDTVFTVAVTFVFGFFPGLAVVALTWITDSLLGITTHPFHPFVIVAIAEVFLVHILKPASQPLPGLSFSIVGRLIPVYAACVLAVSVLGGVIDFAYHTVWDVQRPYYTGINVLRMAFLREGVHVLPANILSRVLVNMVDRLAVIFGGYLISLGIGRILQKKQSAVSD